MNREARIAKLAELIQQAAGTPEYEQWEEEQALLSVVEFRELLNKFMLPLEPWALTRADMSIAKAAAKLQIVIQNERDKFVK